MPRSQEIDSLALLLLAKVEQQGNTKPIDPIIRQKTLAEMIGTIRSRVNFFMNKFRKLGFVSYTGFSGKIEVIFPAQSRVA